MIRLGAIDFIPLAAQFRVGAIGFILVCRIHALLISHGDFKCLFGVLHEKERVDAARGQASWANRRNKPSDGIQRLGLVLALRVYAAKHSVLNGVIGGFHDPIFHPVALLRDGDTLTGFKPGRT